MTEAGERPGLRFQSFIALLENQLSRREGVTVESSKRLIDKDTGRLREHDIIITWRQGHHTIITAMECKDTGRKIGVPTLEAFSKKCEKTGIDHKVIVSASGFTHTAKKKAEALGIRCMELRSIQPHDDVKHELLGLYNFQELAIELSFLAGKMIDLSQHAVILSESGGRSISVSDVETWVIEALANDPGFRIGERQKAIISLAHDDWRMENERGERTDLLEIKAEVEYFAQWSQAPRKRYIYSGEDKEYIIEVLDVDFRGIGRRVTAIRDKALPFKGGFSTNFSHLLDLILFPPAEKAASSEVVG